MAWPGWCGWVGGLTTLWWPDHGVCSARTPQVAAVAHFMARTFFRHWRLYAYVFSHSQELSECTQGLLVRFAPELGMLHFQGCLFRCGLLLQVETCAVPSFELAVAEEDWTAAQV